MTDLLGILADVGLLAFLVIAGMIFLGAGVLALWSVSTALYRHPHGFVGYTKAVGSRIAIAIVLQSAAGFAFTDAPVPLILGVSAGMYLWMFLLFSNLEAPSYTPDVV